MATTYRQITYLVLDELKQLSDDSTFNEEHIIFLLGKYRGAILKQTYKDVKKEILVMTIIRQFRSLKII